MSVDVSIVVPTYCERENLPILVERLAKALKGIKYEIVVVDDNSPDGTAEVARRLSSKYPVRVFVRPGKLGLASAVLTGIRLARGKYVVVMDADLQHPPEVVPQLISALKRADIAVASRFVRGGSAKGLRGLRYLVSRVAWLLSPLAHPRVFVVRDSMSGFFAIRRELVLGTRLRAIGYKILLEILAKCPWRRVLEVPYVFGERVYGRSKLGRGEVINYLVLLLLVSLDTGVLPLLLSTIILIGIAVAALVMLA